MIAFSSPSLPNSYLVIIIFVDVEQLDTHTPALELHIPSGCVCIVLTLIH
jgi:hypothetical protein